MARGRAARRIFWGSLAWLAYTYGGFPALVVVRGLLRSRPLAEGGARPAITVVVPAYNEAAIIVEKLENTLALDYPPELVEVIVASDGSDDGTNDLVAQFGRGVRLLALPRVGKNAAITLAADPAVGGVAGERRHDSGAKPRRRTSAAGKRLLRVLMSRAGSVTSAEGQIYAVRRELFEPVPENVPDDFWVSTRVVARHRRLVYEPRAASYPFTGATVVRRPFERKVRMVGPLFRAFWVGRDLLDPAEYGFYSVQLVSHKLLRRTVFMPLVGLALTTPALLGRGRVYRAAGLAQALLHGSAAAGFLLRGTPFGSLRVAKDALRFEQSCAAAAVALVEQAWGRRPRDDMWEAPPDESEAAARE